MRILYSEFKKRLDAVNGDSSLSMATFKIGLSSFKVVVSWPSTNHGFTGAHQRPRNSRNSDLDPANVRSAGKVMATVFWDSRCDLHWLPGQGRNGYWAIVFRIIGQKFWVKWRGQRRHEGLLCIPREKVFRPVIKVNIPHVTDEKNLRLWFISVSVNVLESELSIPYHNCYNCNIKLQNTNLFLQILLQKRAK